MKDVDDDPSDANAPEIVTTVPLRAERLDVQTQRVVDRIAVVGKRIVTERRMIEVEVAREEFVFEERSVADDLADAVSPRVVHEIILYEERIHVTKTVHAVEAIRIDVRSALEHVRLERNVRREVIGRSDDERTSEL